jgi:hypothetical protein
MTAPLSACTLFEKGICLPAICVKGLQDITSQAFPHFSYLQTYFYVAEKREMFWQMIGIFKNIADCCFLTVLLKSINFRYLFIFHSTKQNSEE